MLLGLVVSEQNLKWKGITVSADFAYMLGQYMVNNERWFTENPQFAKLYESDC